MSENDKRLSELVRLHYDATEARKLAVEEADLMECQVLDGKLATYEAEIKRLAVDGFRVEVSGQGHVGAQEQKQ